MRKRLRIFPSKTARSFLLIGLALIVGDFVELTHLLKTDPIGYVAIKPRQGA